MKANKKPNIRNEKETETAGPKTGKWKINIRLIIPNIKRMAPVAIILNLFLKRWKDAPIPTPNNPVVKGNTISSVGCRMNNSKIVRK